MSFGKNSVYYRQVALLVQVLPLLSKYSSFALKGGTAINMFVQSLPRLSVDIDLVYLPLDDRRKAHETIALELADMANNIRDVIRSSSVHEDLERGRLVISLNNAQIKIEVSLNLRGSVLAPVTADIVGTAEELFGFASVQMLDEKELYAGKLVAALDRQHPRDLFDVKMLMDKGGLDADLIDVFLVYVMSSRRPISELLRPNFKDIGNTFETHFAGMVNVVVSLAELEQAREDMVSLIRSLLTDAQKRFLVALKSDNEDWAEFAYPEAANLPGIQFKKLNIRRMDDAKRRESIAKLEEVLFGS